VDQLAALASWNEALASLGMDLREGHRKVTRIRYKVEINEVTIGSLRGALWQGKRMARRSTSPSKRSLMRRSMEKSPPHRALHVESTHSCVVGDSFLDSWTCLRRISKCSVLVFMCKTVVWRVRRRRTWRGHERLMVMMTNDGRAGCRPRGLKTRVCRLRQDATVLVHPRWIQAKGG